MTGVSVIVDAMSLTRFSRRKFYWLAAVAGFLAAAAWVIHAVFTSTSSTAAIGLIFVPVYGAAAALVAMALLFAAFTFNDAIAQRIAWTDSRIVGAGAIACAVLAFGGSVWLYRDAHAIASNPKSSPEALIAVSQRWIPLWSEDVVTALAKNPSTPPKLLEAIVRAGAGHHLVSLVGANPNTPLALLEQIASGPPAYERLAGLAENPKITPAIAERLAAVQRKDLRDDLDHRLYQTFVLAALARNPATPQAVFDRLAAQDKPEYFLAVAVIYAERASCAQIRRAGESGGENQVLRSTADSQLKRRGC